MSLMGIGGHVLAIFTLFSDVIPKVHLNYKTYFSVMPFLFW